MKLVIWDADDTLWDGTIYHGDQVKLKDETVEVLKQIDKLGIMQIVCSRNSHDIVSQQLKDFGIMKYFASVIAKVPIDKSKEISNMLELLKIEPEETLFVDDNAVIREHVRLTVGCHVDYSTDLYEIMKYFNVDRLALMNEQRTRTQAEKNWKGSFRDFLKQIEVKVKFKSADEKEIPRIANLANRTNELNAVRNRYSEQDIKDIINSEKSFIKVVYMKDKFGDYGLIGEAIIDKSFDNTWFIRDICISCRTMGRGIGSKLLTHIKLMAKQCCVNRVIGNIIPTKENHRMRDLFEGRGFEYVTNVGATEVYEWYP